MARYQVEFYEDERGRSQVLEWLEELRRQDEKLFSLAMRLLKQLETQGPDIRPPLAKPLKGLGAPIWELRHRRGIRIYYWRQDKDLFVVAAGEVKDQDHPDPRLLDLSVRAFHKRKRVN